MFEGLGSAVGRTAARPDSRARSVRAGGAGASGRPQGGRSARAFRRRSRPVLRASLGAILLGALLGAASLGTSAGLAGGWYPGESKSRAGCGASKGSPPTFSLRTGMGHWNGSASARTCTNATGGPTTNSTGRALAVTTVILPVRLGAHSRGVRVTWNVSAILSTSVRRLGAASTCPTTTNLSSVNYGYTWANTSTRTQDCVAVAVASQSGSAYLDDLTTGAQTPASFSWPGLTNVSGRAVIDSGYSIRYSNSSYWRYNYSSQSSSNASYGAAARLNVSLSATWYVNGSFVASDRYVLVLTFTDSVLAEAVGFSKAASAASVDVRGSGLYEELLRPVVF